ncbi:MAG: RDD family protein [Planctomycetota bacterium]|nr:RDD family protein [Planctomycetota bacterium]
MSLYPPVSACLRAWWLLTTWIICIPASVVAFADPPTSTVTRLDVASGGGNVWVVTQDPAMVGRWRLLHHNQAMDGPYARVSRILSSRPLAIAAREDRVLVAINQFGRSAAGIDLLGLRIARDPTMGSFYELPLDSWEVLANIPADQPFKGLALGPEGPLALLGPSPRAAKGVKRTGAADPDPTPESGARLLEQRAFAWHDLPLPDDLTRTEQIQLLPSVGAVHASILSSDSAGGAILHQLVEESWSSFSLGISYEAVTRFTQTASRLGFTTDSSSPETLELRLLRGPSLLDLGTVDRPARPWGLGAIEEDLLVISSWDPNDEANIGLVQVERVDGISGTVSPPVRWARLPLDVTDWLQLPLIGTLMVTALLAIMLFRPTEDLELPLKMGVTPMPLGRRLLALGVDLIPGIILVGLVFGYDGVEPRGFLWSAEFAFSPPGALILGVTLLHETVSELIWGRSAGKMIFGGVVLSSMGERPSRRAVLLRAVFKGVILCAPILGIFTLFSPARQGIPETVSRTVVADRFVGRNRPDPE